jgi:hypothetical protein
VYEASADISVKNFTNRQEAIQYGDDAASETDDNPPIAKVFDDEFRLIHTGRSWLWLAREGGK